MKKMRPDVRVVLSSGFDENEIAEKMKGEGVAGFIMKPYKLDELGTEIRKAIGSAARSD
jgi:DNA-binding NarL/FixJ family response regulator